MTRYGFDDENVDGISWSMIDRHFALRNYDALSGEVILEPLAPVQKFCMDIRTIKWGCLCFRPFEARLVPLGQPRPEIPDGTDADGKPLFQNALDIRLISHFGLRRWLATGAFLTRDLCALLSELDEAPEARRGEIPVLAWTAAKPRRVQRGPGAGRTFHLPLLECIAWTPRPDFLGPVTVPVPTAEPSITFETCGLALPAPTSGQSGAPGAFLDDSIPFAPESR